MVYVRQSSPGQVANHPESRRRQYGLVERAVALGWAREEVVVIDDDQGVSGAGGKRAGFEKLVTEVGLGRVGIVLGLEASRLARNNADWYRLLDLCGALDTLIGDTEGVYHPGLFNDRMLLGLKGTMSEAELHLIRSRLQGGLWAKARRGELKTHLPVGYVHDPEGDVVVTPDEAVREAVALVFAKFTELGSARAVAGYFTEEGLPLPHRSAGHDRVEWRSATFAPVHRILTNPTYAGMFVYGRSKTERKVDESGTIRIRPRPLPPEEWEVVIEGHHPGFITPAVFWANQQRLRANWRGPSSDTRGAAREGAALLQGLLRCGKCGRRMQVSYSGSGGTVRRYACHQAHRLHGTATTCQSLGGRRLERAVTEAFMQVLSPVSVEATLGALTETEARWRDELTSRELGVEQARFEAERARRQFDACEPENRLVARTLERTWEQRLSDLTARQHDLARFQSERPAPLTDHEVAWLHHAGADLTLVWNAPTTSHRDRKQLLRCLITEVVVTVDRERLIGDARIVWVGGAATDVAVKLNRPGRHGYATDAEVIELVRRLALHLNDERIAFVLNRKRLRTGKGNTFTTARVKGLRQRHRIPAPPQIVTPGCDDATWMTVKQAAAALDVSGDTIRRWAREGFLEAHQITTNAPWTVRVTDQVRQQIVPQAPDGWVGLSQAAEHLGRSKQTILHWVHSGKLRAVQVTKGKRKGLRIETGDHPGGLFADH